MAATDEAMSRTAPPEERFAGRLATQTPRRAGTIRTTAITALAELGQQRQVGQQRIGAGVVDAERPQSGFEVCAQGVVHRDIVGARPGRNRADGGNEAARAACDNDAMRFSSRYAAGRA